MSRRFTPCEQRALTNVHQRCDRGAEQRDLDALAAAAPLAMEECGADGAHRMMRRQHVCERDADFIGSPSGSVMA